jgi:hypothetical protein
MSNLSNEQEILLKEYQEAGETCRNHDQLIRTGFSIFAAVQAAIIGFIGTKKDIGSLELVLLEVLGLWLSVVILLTTLRLHYRNKAYMERAKCIENQLGMYLYQYSFDYFDIEKEKIPGQWAGNKKLWASVSLLTFFLYTVLLLRDGSKLITDILKCHRKPQKSRRQGLTSARFRAGCPCASFRAMGRGYENVPARNERNTMRRDNERQ